VAYVYNPEQFEKMKENLKNYPRLFKQCCFCGAIGILGNFITIKIPILTPHEETQKFYGDTDSQQEEKIICWHCYDIVDKIKKEEKSKWTRSLEYKLIFLPHYEEILELLMLKVLNIKDENGNRARAFLRGYKKECDQGYKTKKEGGDFLGTDLKFKKFCKELWKCLKDENNFDENKLVEFLSSKGLFLEGIEFAIPTEEALTTEKEVLNCIMRGIDNAEDIAKELGFTAVETARRHLRALEEKKLVTFTTIKNKKYYQAAKT